MNRQTVQKAQLFFMGIKGRIEESADFAQNITVIFTAGTKNFFLKAEPVIEGDGESKTISFEYIFSGLKHKGGIDALIKFTEERMPEYDSMVFRYNERGRSIVIEANGKEVKSRTETIQTPATKIPQKSLIDDEGFTAPNAKHVPGTAVMSNREYYIKPDSARNLLTEINIMGKNGKVKNDMIRKYNQIDHFVELLHPLLVSLTSGKADKNVIRVIDCGCGKSYLSFVLNYYIKEVLGKKCFFTGLDYNHIVIEDSKRMAKNLGYSNMEFICTDINEYVPDKQYDLLLTLHACDIATDYALNFALKNEISHIVSVPCCHREMNNNYLLPGFEDVMKYGILKARIADSLTDGLRAKYMEACGYDVSIVEYISPLDTPKNLMIKAEKKRAKDYDQIKKFYDLCELLGTKLTIGDF